MTRKHRKKEESRRRKDADLSPEDEAALAADDALFEAAVRDVGIDRALAGKYEVSEAAVQRARQSRAAELDAADADLFAQAVADLDPAAARRRAAEEPTPDVPAARPPRARLARSRPRHEDRLDLHGLRRDEALVTLARVLHRARQRGARLVVVVTGRGKHSDVDGPVLRAAVEEWIRNPAGRELVAEHYPAPPEEGGAGALLVFLRPPRKD